jgi:hypothetical protein
MGEMKVPADALWERQTQRAVESFPIGYFGRASSAAGLSSRRGQVGCLGKPRRKARPRPIVTAHRT